MKILPSLGTIFRPIFRPIFRRDPLISFNGYLILVSCIGLVLVCLGGLQATAHFGELNYLLFLFFAILSAIVTTSMPTDDGSGITYHIGSAISIAVVPFAGIGAAVLVAAIQGLCTWFVKPAEKGWKKTARQLCFNLGMDAISIFGASVMLYLLQLQLGADSLLGATVPWLLAALFYNEINLWLLGFLFRLQQGPEFRMEAFWREERWATKIDVILMVVGGALLSFAAQSYDWQGVVLFFLPILLSAYAFRLYGQKMRTHLDNLDQIVGERTASLQQAMEQLQQEIATRRRVEEELRILAAFDVLTNVFNRRSFFEASQHQVALACQSKEPFAILMFDLDRFKQVNDRYGHAAGDAVLKHFTTVCKAIVIEANILGRLGGEEFAMFLPHCDAVDAVRIGERIRIQLALTPIRYQDQAIFVTVSVGVATIDWQSEEAVDFEIVLEESDRHLYLAKRRGGNCVINQGMNDGVYWRNQQHENPTVSITA